jgi:hypothetical protein
MHQRTRAILLSVCNTTDGKKCARHSHHNASGTATSDHPNSRRPFQVRSDLLATKDWFTRKAGQPTLDPARSFTDRNRASDIPCNARGHDHRHHHESTTHSIQGLRGRSGGPAIAERTVCCQSDHRKGQRYTAPRLLLRRARLFLRRRARAGLRLSLGTLMDRQSTVSHARFMLAAAARWNREQP